MQGRMPVSNREPMSPIPNLLVMLLLLLLVISSAPAITRAQWTSNGGITIYYSAGCSGVNIPQNGCSFSSCVNSFTQQVISGTNQAQLISGSSLAGSWCCPNIVGTYSGSTFTAMQSATGAYGPSKVQLQYYSSGVVQIRWTDLTFNQYCTTRYNVNWGNVGGTGTYLPSSSTYAYVSWYLWFWVPVLIFCVLMCVVCAHPRTRPTAFNGVIYRPPMTSAAPPQQQIPVAQAVSGPTVTGVPVAQSGGGDVTVEYNPATGRYEQRRVVGGGAGVPTQSVTVV